MVTPPPEGETLAEIAARHGRPHSTVRNRWATQADFPPPVGKRGRAHIYDPAAVDAWVAEHLTRPTPDLEPGRLYTAAEIAEAAGLDPVTIRADLSRGRWPAPDDTADGTNRWRGDTATAALTGRQRRRRADSRGTDPGMLNP